MRGVNWLKSLGLPALTRLQPFPRSQTQLVGAGYGKLVARRQVENWKQETEWIQTI